MKRKKEKERERERKRKRERRIGIITNTNGRKISDIKRRRHKL